MDSKQNKGKTGAPCLILGLGHTGCDALGILPFLKQYPEIDLLGIDTDSTDIQNLRKRGVDGLLLGEEAVNGNGTSADNSQAVLILRDAEKEIEAQLENRRLLIAIAAFGGGTGSAVEEILSMADNLGVSAVLLAVMPFSFESAERKSTAEKLLLQTDVHCQAVVVIPNEKLLAHYPQESAADAFSSASAYLAMAATGIATPFASKNLFNVTPGILATLASVDGNPRCHFIQCSCGAADGMAELADLIREDPVYKDIQGHAVVDRGIAFLRVNGNCREEEMEFVLNNISNIFSDANLDVAACLDEEMPFYCSLTLLLHCMQQVGDDVEEEDVEEDVDNEEEAISEASPKEAPPLLAPSFREPKGKNRKSGRKGAWQNSSQLTFDFPEYLVGIFAGDPQNLWNGVNVDIPTFRRMNELIDKGT